MLVWHAHDTQTHTWKNNITAEQRLQLKFLSANNVRYVVNPALPQVRILDIVTSLGLFAGKLWLDRAKGVDNDPSIMKQRAAELR